jgi:hypothetical protein
VVLEAASISASSLRSEAEKRLKEAPRDTNKQFAQRDVTLSDQHIHANGNLAWEMG